MKLLHDEKGQALVLTATSMLVLMGFLALATDVGVLFHARREMQTAADGAAVAGALEEQRGGTATEIVAAADNAAISNGYTNGSNGVTVTVHTPPTSGYHQTGGYIEVDISQSAIPTVLMGLFGQKNFTVATRAVAGLTAATKSCDNQLGGTGPDLTLRGSATINGIDCAINVASNSSDSVDTIGNGNTMNVAYIATEGGFSGSGTPQGTPTISGLAAGSVTDPFGTTVSSGEPALSACSQTISGNSYSGQLGVTTGTPTSTTVYCFSGTNVNIDGATLSNGVFVFEQQCDHLERNAGSLRRSIPGTIQLDVEHFGAQDTNRIR
jgi:Flp pilus assembly protein TadG